MVDTPFSLEYEQGMNLFSTECLQRRQARVAKALDSLLKDSDLLLTFCGEPVTKPGGLDQTYLFLPHPEYFWLTGHRRPGGVMAYSKRDGWIEFQRPISRDERVWEGAEDRELSTESRSLEKLSELQKKYQRVFVTGQASSKDHSLSQGSDPEALYEIQSALDRTRRIKDEEEVKLIQEIAQMAHRGYQRVLQVIRPGISEREIQIEFEAEIQRAGAHKTPYDTIVGAGTNAAILHAIPTNRILEKDDLVLMDAGADIFDYCVDITRVFSASGRFTTQQQQIYDLVKEAQSQAIQECQIAKPWPQVHERAARVIAEGLRQLKILKGSVDSALETGAISMFFPHGVGHLVGLRVRDTGQEENRNPKTYFGVRIRIDLELEANHLVTVEPGCYFIKALLEDADSRRKYDSEINWSEVDRWKDFGGVRIEDDILITASGPQNLTQMITK